MLKPAGVCTIRELSTMIDPERTVSMDPLAMKQGAKVWSFAGAEETASKKKDITIRWICK